MDERNSRRALQGTVIRNKMTKTVVVQVERRERHPKYEKVIVRKKISTHTLMAKCLQ